MTIPVPLWQQWAPPLDPPTEGGLPERTAQAIYDAIWPADPYLAAAMMWESYAATLPTEASVVQVATGAQSVTYAAGTGGGAFGLAIARAKWFRSMAGSLTSVELRGSRGVVVGEADEPEWLGTGL